MKPYLWLVLLLPSLPEPAAGHMAPVGGELAIAQGSGAFHRSPAVAAGELGTFVLVWQRHTGGAEGWDVLARVHARSGAPLGAEIVVNTTMAGRQQAPAVAADSAGNFVVAWQSEGQDGSGWVLQVNSTPEPTTPSPLFSATDWRPSRPGRAQACT